MYLLYKTKDCPGGLEFKRGSQASLAGNASGIVVKYLRTVMTPKDSERFEWEIDTKKAIGALGLSGDVVVVDIKPKSDKVLLFELQRIYGVSSHEWTPIMLELRELIVDEPASKWDKSRFVIGGYGQKEIVYTFLYLRGSVRDGKPVRTWNFPRPSSTNGPLLWPDTMKYFISKLQHG